MRRYFGSIRSRPSWPTNCRSIRRSGCRFASPAALLFGLTHRSRRPSAPFGVRLRSGSLSWRRNDVADAARIRGIDPERFITEVQKANAVPFAIKPLTLNLLLRLFERDGA